MALPFKRSYLSALTRRTTRRRPVPFRLSLEPLEERTLLSTAGADFVPGEVLIGFDRNVAATYQSRGPAAALTAADQLVDRFGLQNGRLLAAPPVVSSKSIPVASRWSLPAGTSVPEMIARLAGTPGIAYVEPNYIIHASAIPNDTRFSEQWALNNTGQTGGTADADIDAPEAWNLSTGSSSVVVGVIDTGVDYTHPDLAANIWTNPGEIPGDGIDNDGNGFIDDVHGWDFANNDNDPFDDNGHGTHVSGTIAATGNNNLGVAGVNWNAKIMALKFLDANGSGPTSGAVAAINYATMMRNRRAPATRRPTTWITSSRLPPPTPPMPGRRFRITVRLR
jgi:subtilisin family serine protease